MHSRILLVCASILLISSSVNAQRISRREEPILAGTNGAIPIPWKAPMQSLSGIGSWSGYSNTPNGPVFSISGNRPGTFMASVVVGGSFDSIGNVPMNNIAIANQPNYLPQWEALGSGVHGGAVYSTLMNDTEVFAAGSFDTAGGIATNRIAMWDGTSWHSLGSGSANGVDSTVLAMAVMGDSIYVGGNFTHAGGIEANHIAIWNIRTSKWEAIIENGVNGVDGGVAALLVDDSAIYVGGGFRHAADIPASKIAELKFGQWSVLGSGVDDPDGIVECFNIKGSGNFYQTTIGAFWVGGHFSKIGDTVSTNLASWDIFSHAWSPTEGNPFKDALGTIYSVASGWGTYAGGDFILADSTLPKYFMEMYYGGNYIGSGIDGPAFALVDQSLAFSSNHNKNEQPLGHDEYVLIGGGFEHAGGIYTPHFAQWGEGSDAVNAGTTPNASFTSFPNPVEQNAALSFVLPTRDHVMLTLFDELGRKVATLADQDYDAGTYEIPFQRGTNNGSGILLGVLKTNEAMSTCKIVLK